MPCLILNFGEYSKSLWVFPSFDLFSSLIASTGQEEQWAGGMDIWVQRSWRMNPNTTPWPCLSCRSDVWERVELPITSRLKRGYSGWFVSQLGSKRGAEASSLWNSHEIDSLFKKKRASTWIHFCWFYREKSGTMSCSYLYSNHLA